MTRLVILGLSLLVTQPSAAQVDKLPAQGAKPPVVAERAAADSEEVFVYIHSVKGNRIAISDVPAAAGRGRRGAAGSAGGSPGERSNDAGQPGEPRRGKGVRGPGGDDAAVGERGQGEGGRSESGTRAPRVNDGKAGERPRDQDTPQNARRGNAGSGDRAESAQPPSSRRSSGGGAGRAKRAPGEPTGSLSIPTDAKVTTATRERRTNRLLSGAELAGGLSHSMFAKMNRPIEARIVRRSGKVVEVNVIVAASDVNHDGAERPSAVKPNRPGSASGRSK